MNNSNQKTLAVLQPGYLPWLGFFDQMHRCDVFVIYDDVQFDKNGWRNRNRIKSPAGPHWLTVPVHVRSLEQRILDVEIGNRQPWARKHLGTIQQFYKKAPYLEHYWPALEELLSKHWERIVDLDIALINQLRLWLGLSCEVVRSSQLTLQGDRNERLLNLCSYFDAGVYLSGSAARNYLDVSLFESQGIEVRWQDYVHPVYSQLYGEFIPYLSVLDLLLNCGDKSSTILSSTVSAGVP